MSAELVAESEARALLGNEGEITPGSVSMDADEQVDTKGDTASKDEEIESAPDTGRIESNRPLNEHTPEGAEQQPETGVTASGGEGTNSDPSENLAPQRPPPPSVQGLDFSSFGLSFQGFGTPKLPRQKPGLRSGGGRNDAALEASTYRGMYRSAAAPAGKAQADDPRRDLLKGAEKLQESAVTAFNSFFGAGFGALPDGKSRQTDGGIPLVDSPAGTIPLVDQPVARTSTAARQTPSAVLNSWRFFPTALQSTPKLSPKGSAKPPPGLSKSQKGPGSIPHSALDDIGSKDAVPAQEELVADGQLASAESAKSSESLKGSEPSGEGKDLEPGVNAPPERQAIDSTPSGADVVVDGGGSAVETAKEGNSEVVPPGTTGAALTGLGTFTKGILDSSKSAAKALQLRARHMVSQNKRRYQDGEFDLDMTYITETIIAMGFPAGDLSSGILGFVEGLYRNHMEDVIRFLETTHKDKYKVYNLCSERLYDAALFEGKVASFPFDDHNCPPLAMLGAFCQSAYSWLKGGIDHVVVVHCKAGMARTGLMLCCLLLHIKFFPTAEEVIQYYNDKRATDGKALTLPSQLRYVKYYERILHEHSGVAPKPRKVILRGIRLHRCPYWIRPSITISNHQGVVFSTRQHPTTRDLSLEDIWHNAPRRGVVVFALPGERSVVDLTGDFKILFQDRHGDFFCWLNTNLMESRQMLPTSQLDWFDKRRLGSPGFQVEVVVLDQNTPLPPRAKPPSPATSNPSFTSGMANAFQALVGGGAIANSPPPGNKGKAQEAPSGKPIEKGQQRSAGGAAAAESTAEVGGEGGKNDDVFTDSEDEKEDNVKEEEVKVQVNEQGKGKDSTPPGSTGTGGTFGAIASALTSSFRGYGQAAGRPASGSDSGENTNSDALSSGEASEKATGVSSLASGRGAAAESAASGSALRTGNVATSASSLRPQTPPAGTSVSTGPEPSAVVTAVKSGSQAPLPDVGAEQSAVVTHVEEQGSSTGWAAPPTSDFKAVVADSSVFTFGDDEDYESE